MDTEVTPDGSPVELYRRLTATDEPAIIDAAIPPGSAILELGSGAGRVTHRLLELGHSVVAVDESADMLRWIKGADTVLSTIEGLDLGRRFDAVLMASHLVNTSDDEQRRQFLLVCARHVRPDGVVLIQHHTADWAETAAEGSSEREGVITKLTAVRRHPPFVSAEMVYDIDGRVFRQPFTARMFTPDELAAELEAAGLRLSRQINPTWSEARPA